MDNSLTPPGCSKEQANADACQPANNLQLAVLYLALILQVVGFAGVRPCVSPFGASQFNQSTPEEMKQLKHYFSWYPPQSLSSLVLS
jgi:peptide/histidine transporter 3/4